MQPILTQPTSQYPTPVYAPDALDSPTPLHCEDTSEANQLANKSNLPVDRLAATNDMLSGI